VLQERQVVRLGARKPIDVDVRLIAATNVDLAQAVEAGHFRRDLYYRLNIATLALPPLAQRPADILVLADHFIAVYSRRLGLSGVRLGAGAQAALLAHSWPGNIRELENVIHYALIIGKGEEISVEALNLRVAPGLASLPAPAGLALQALPPAESESPLELLRRGLRGLFETGDPNLYETIEREAIRLAFEFCHRNQVHSAGLLGITRNVLRAQLKRFGMLSERGRRLPGHHEALSGALGAFDLGAAAGAPAADAAVDDMAPGASWAT
jgi:sigma-54-specific transcriptional regulator